MRRDCTRKSRLPQWRGGRALVACSGAMALLAIIACGAPAGADAPGEIRSYTLGPGDRIKVTVIGEKELSGNFDVDVAGNVLLPLVGSVEVTNLTVSELQQRMVARFADGFLKKPSVFISIAEVRPIQILGDVKKPGSYPYRHGTLVKGAIAQAGGFGLAEQNPAEAVSLFLAADERVHVLGATRRRLFIRQARMKAQLDGAKTFTPSTFSGQPHDDHTTKVIAEERATLARQTEDLERKLKLIQALKPRLVSEGETIDRLISSEKKQIALVQQRIEEYDSLTRKGLGRSSTTIDLKLILGNRRSDVWRLESDHARVQINIAELKVRLENAKTSYKAEIFRELQTVRQRLHEVEVMLPTACEIREVRLRQTGRSIGAEPARDIKITRLRDKDVTTFQATETTLLEPGDIVEVRTLLRSGRRSPMASVKRMFRESRKPDWCFSTVEQAEWLAPNLDALISGETLAIGRPFE